MGLSSVTPFLFTLLDIEDIDVSWGKSLGEKPTTVDNIGRVGAYLYHRNKCLSIASKVSFLLNTHLNYNNYISFTGSIPSFIHVVTCAAVIIHT